MLAIVTGASSGLGKDFCYLLSKNGYDLIIASRSVDKLNEIKADIESKYPSKVEVIQSDLSKDVGSLIQATNSKKVDLLINNAGFGDFCEFTLADYNKLDQMVDLNCKALMKLSHHYASIMKEQGNGRILNVASVASFQPGPYMAVYYASKAFVLSLSESLDYELKPFGVRVSALCPGPTKTDFFKNAGSDAKKMLNVTKPLESKEVVEYAYKKMMKNKRVIIPGFKFRLLLFFEKLIPRSLTLNILGKIQSKRKN